MMKRIKLCNKLRLSSTIIVFVLFFSLFNHLLAEQVETSSLDSKYSGTFFVPGVDKTTIVYDSNKTYNDSNMCWAHAFACMVAWYQDMLESVGVEISAKELREPIAIVNALKESSGNFSGSFSRGIQYYIIEDGYMLSYINAAAWNPIRPTAYKGYDRTNVEETFSSLESFSQLLFDNLYKGVAFADLYYPNSVGGHAVAIWGAEFENSVVKAVYISDSDDNKDGFVRYSVVCEDGWVRLSGHWAPRIHALTFLWAPNGVDCPVPSNPTEEVTSVTLTSKEGASVIIKIPHTSTWMKEYLKIYPNTYEEQLYDDSDGDGFTDIEEYVVGSNPNDNTDCLKITNITFETDGLPTIEHYPRSNDGVAEFIIQGSKNLDGPWSTHTKTNTTHRFFRVIAKPID